MDFETPYAALAPHVFDGDNYQIWAARIEAHLEAKTKAHLEAKENLGSY